MIKMKKILIFSLPISISVLSIFSLSIRLTCVFENIVGFVSIVGTPRLSVGSLNFSTKEKKATYSKI